MKTEKHDAIVLSSEDEKDHFKLFTALLESTIPDDEILANVGAYLTSKNSRGFCFSTKSTKILPTHGMVMEFGVRWGQTLSLLASLRSIFEPFNRHRKIVGFDTFAGFVGTSDKDGARGQVADGSFSVSADYEAHLTEILASQEALNPMSHLRRFELVKGDAVETVPAYLSRHPETLVSLAIFDFDIYRPTRAALEAIKPHVFKGTVLVFDELADDIFPGETIALREVFDIADLRIQRFPMTSRISYVVLE